MSLSGIVSKGKRLSNIGGVLIQISLRSQGKVLSRNAAVVNKYLSTCSGNCINSSRPVLSKSQLTSSYTTFNTSDLTQTLGYRFYSTAENDKPTVDNSDERSKELGQPKPQVRITIFQRFKNAYKEYGKVLIGVHVATSVVWFGSFFYLAQSGLDVVPWLEKLNFSDTLIKPFLNPTVGNTAVAYLMYKLATPARYTVTIGGTQLTVMWLRRIGYMDPVPQGDSFRDLVKEGSDKMKERREEFKDQLKERREGLKDQMIDKKDEFKDQLLEKKDEFKDKFKDSWKKR